MELYKEQINSPVIQDVKIKKDSRFADLVFGSISGFTGKIVEYPFDTIKVHLQTQERQGLTECVKNIISKQGFHGFFQGISAPLVGSMAENAVLFLAYNQIQQSIRLLYHVKPSQALSIQQLCMAGGLSGAVVSFVLTPIELLKCRLQTQSYLSKGSLLHKGPMSVFMHTLKSKGITGLYQGHTGTLLREVAGGVAWFGIYEWSVKRLLAQDPYKVRTKADLSAWELMGAGALAGMGYNSALYPADVVKSRMQSGLHGNDGFLKIAKEIYQTHGARFFFRGFGLTVCRSAPSSAIIFYSYEWLNRNFGKK